MHYRLIALDLDGTLLNRRLEISPRTRAALTAARERGILTVIATGRTRHSAAFWSRHIGGGPVICCNGGMVMDEHGEILWSRPIPKPLLVRALQLATAAGTLAECYTAEGLYLRRTSRHVTSFLSWVRPRLSLTAALLAFGRFWRTNRVRAVRDLAVWAGKPSAPAVVKISVLGQPQGLADLAARLSREVPGLEVTNSGATNLEITAAGATKGSALEQLGARLQIPREAMIAVGDSANDLEMIRYAGLGVAMGNGAPDALAAADRVTATCDGEGVAQLIEEMCLS